MGALKGALFVQAAAADGSLHRIRRVARLALALIAFAIVFNTSCALARGAGRTRLTAADVHLPAAASDHYRRGDRRLAGANSTSRHHHHHREKPPVFTG
jgi:hypothetical protein